ncbi:MAG: dUTP diphosphatase [Chlamydiae bacterium]|nr:dUTP diphosphatase [Chlamydiota bacterium]
MEKKEVFVRVKSEKVALPLYATEQASCADIRAFLEKDLILEPGESKLIPTGLFVEIPEGFEIQIRPRSGLALKEQITVLNTPATIDADYRGEIQVILINHGKKSFIVTNGMRIAQIALAPIAKADFVIKQSLSATARGEGGFGHTGKI